MLCFSFYLVFNCFTCFKFNYFGDHLNRSMSRLDRHRRIFILTLIHISFRFRIWGPINTCFIDLRIEIWIIYEFYSIRSLTFFTIPSNPREYPAFRADFLNPLIISRSRNTYPFFIAILFAAQKVTLHHPHLTSFPLRQP